MKELKDWTFDELINSCCEIVLRELLKGDFRVGVGRAVDLAVRWRSEKVR